MKINDFSILSLLARDKQCPTTSLIIKSSNKVSPLLATTNPCRSHRDSMKFSRYTLPQSLYIFRYCPEIVFLIPWSRRYKHFQRAKGCRLYRYMYIHTELMYMGVYALRQKQFHTHIHTYSYIYIFESCSNSYKPQHDFTFVKQFSYLYRPQDRNPKVFSSFIGNDCVLQPQKYSLMLLLCGYGLELFELLSYIYIYIYICISSSSSSSSFCRATSTDIPDPVSPLLPIVHRFWEVLRSTSPILTELLYVGSSWSPCFCSAMWGGPWGNITYELLPTSPVVSSMSGTSNFDGFHDGW